MNEIFINLLAKVDKNRSGSLSLRFVFCRKKLYSHRKDCDSMEGNTTQTISDATIEDENLVQSLSLDSEYDR